MTAAPNKLPRWKVRLFWTLLGLALILGSVKLLDHPEPGLNFFTANSWMNDYSREEALRFSLYRVLFDFGIRVDWITGDSQSKTVLIPADLPLVEPYTALIAKFRDLDADLIAAESNPDGNRLMIEVGLNRKSLFRITLLRDPELRRFAGKIAIVIDDFGYSFGSLTKGFLDLDQEVTLSILPGLKYSKRIAQAAVAANREVMLHLPMEAKNDEVGFEDLILHTRLADYEIRDRLRKALRAIPYATGLNNHMGSLATEDARLVAVMMDELKKMGLFFLDSHTNAKTLAYSEAGKRGIPCAINNTFLDAIKEEPFIREQVYLLAEITSRKGQAIGIGHPEKLTLKVLQEELPKLERRGFQFVSISNIIEKNIGRGIEVSQK